MVTWLSCFEEEDTKVSIKVHGCTKVQKLHCIRLTGQEGERGKVNHLDFRSLSIAIWHKMHKFIYQEPPERTLIAHSFGINRTHYCQGCIGPISGSLAQIPPPPFISSIFYLLFSIWSCVRSITKIYGPYISPSNKCVCIWVMGMHASTLIAPSFASEQQYQTLLFPISNHSFYGYSISVDILYYDHGYNHYCIETDLPSSL